MKFLSDVKKVVKDAWLHWREFNFTYHAYNGGYNERVDEKFVVVENDSFHNFEIFTNKTLSTPDGYSFQSEVGFVYAKTNQQFYKVKLYCTTETEGTKMRKTLNDWAIHCSSEEQRANLYNLSKTVLNINYCVARYVIRNIDKLTEKTGRSTVSFAKFINDKLQRWTLHKYMN